MPIRPLGHAADLLAARPREAFAAYTDAIAQCLAATEDEVQVSIGRVDYDCPGRFAAGVINQLATELGRQLFGLPRLRLIIGWQGRIAGTRRAGLDRPRPRGTPAPPAPPRRP